ncbi:canalicular multispecific organic anion transporter 1 [Stylonychia lemnae]|uniref:Canalicular multispecific organic anion transporter 1 n=1 Tax=Stylonychia lemnae TaxID=5949 RepID=A0A077ZSL6_STYLE|nr:canalicular multispecific organic anion transporter 1 [Stylonychia lemnae]|eukprot:CDW72862.1 canalicular multispecific organic anion transporter 1 [Stylonychia lemnae]
MGSSFFAGIAVMVAAFCVNLFVTKFSTRYQTAYMKLQDQRVNLTTECLNNIKMLKLYSWQEAFEKMIEQKRSEELAVLWKRFTVSCINSTSLYFFPSILGAAVFSTYIGSGNTLDLSVAYTVNTIFNLIKFEEEDKNSIKIQEGNFHWGILNKKEKEELQKKQHKGKKGKKGIENKANEQKQEDNQQLLNELDDKRTTSQFLAIKNLNIEFRHGEFTCIIGDVGSGKSTLLSAIIGDLLYLDPQFMMVFKDEPLNERIIETIKQDSSKLIVNKEPPIILSENVAYVQQNPWIQNKTIRENILFGQEYDEDKYQETIDICQLSRDLEILPSGDQTEIGEKGINLSGGQKARVSLARAVYSDRAIMLMDDPISALDANVKKKIFKKVFMEKFKNKTRLLVTHAIDFIHLVDRVIVLSKGEIVLDGNYTDGAQSHAINEEVKYENPYNKNQSDGRTSFSSQDSDSESIDSQSDSVQDIESGSENENEELKEGQKKKRKNKQYRTFSFTTLTDEQKGKIISDENIEETKVGSGVYRKYVNYLGGWKIVVLLLFIFVIFTVARILADLQIGNWASSTKQKSEFSYYCGLTFMYAFLQSAFEFLRVSTLQYRSWLASKKIHKDMIKTVLNAPINLYFDVTPIGRILNKFSRDLQVIELQLSWQIGPFFVLLFNSLSIMTVSAIVVPWIVILIVLLSLVAVRIYTQVINSFKEMTRIESLTKSPLLSFIGESCSDIMDCQAICTCWLKNGKCRQMLQITGNSLRK